jgi:hypothetical protein
MTKHSQKNEESIPFTSFHKLCPYGEVSVAQNVWLVASHRAVEAITKTHKMLVG